MKHSLFEKMDDEYPSALEQRHDYILTKLVELWDKPEIDDYFTSLLLDKRGGRKGFAPEVFNEIQRLHKFRESQRLSEVEDKLEAMRELELRGLDFKTSTFLNAIKEGNQGLVDLFVRGGINVNVNDVDGNNGLGIALKRGFTVIANILLEAKADVNVKDVTGFTPLLMACGKTTHGFKEVAEKLIHMGADVNVRDPLGWTPLLLAISAGNADVVGLLLENGANPTVRTRKGESARDLARKYGHEDLIDLL